jgi:hypothetical protein
MQRAMVDRLIEFTERNAETIAEQWYRVVSTHERTKAFHCLTKEGCLRQAISMCKNLKQMYFSENCFQAVAHFLDVQGLVENYFARGIPLEEVIYALILLRRHIWLQADLQAIWNPTLIDMYQAVESNNRILLIFDYATYIAAIKYREVAAKTSNLTGYHPSR